MIDTLPQNLVDTILGYLAKDGDRPSLRACALTCGPMLPACQKHLFRSIVIVDEAESGQLISILAANPELGSVVHSLNLIEGPDSDSLFVEKVLPHLAESMLSVEVLSFTGVVFDDKIIWVIREHFNAAHTLNMLRCTFDTFPDLTSVLRSFHELEDLSLLSTTWLSHSDEPPAAQTDDFPLPLRTMRATQYSPDDVCLAQWLSNNGSLGQVTTLELRFGNKLQGLDVWLRAAGDSLEDLAVKGANHYLDTLHLFDLSANASLRYISLGEMDARYPRWLAPVLRSISAAAPLQALIFEIRTGIVDMDDWTVVGDLLKHAPFEGLREVAFVLLSPDQDITWLEKQVRSAMPGLFYRGIVHFRYPRL